MLFQSEVSKELQFLVYLIPVVMGIQLAFYFFYQYYKIRDTQLRLNRVLLAFGSFVLFIVLGPLLIQISRNFSDEGLLYEIISRMGWGCAFFSTIAVSIFIIKKDFSTIINLRIVKILMLLNFIPIILVFLIPSTQSPIFIISILFVVLNGLYVIRFQIILVKRSVGNIKKKFKLFFLGAMVSFPSLFFAVLVGLEVLPPIINEIVYYIGISELLIGFVIIYFSVYDFPPFYEFEWRENLLKLFIINQKNNNCLFYWNFSEALHKEPKLKQNYFSLHDQVFSSSISGIEKIINAITGTRNQKLDKIKHEDSQIILEYGINPSDITYVLVVKKDLLSAHHLLKVIKTQFESFFKEILVSLQSLKENQEQLFGSFNIVINSILKQQRGD